MKVMVLAVATYADPATRRMFDHVAARGVEVVLVMPRRIRHPFGPADVPETPWPTPGVVLERLDTWYSHDNGTHVVMRGLPGLIRRHRPDVIHCVLEPWSLTCLQVAALLATMQRGSRPRLGVQAGETKPEQGARMAAVIRKSLYRAMLRRCDYFMGWSPLVIRAAERMGLNGLPHSVAPAVGVNTEVFHPPTPELRLALRSEMGYQGDDFLVGYVGRFVEEKGVQDLVAAMDLATVPNPRLRLAMLGTGPLENSLREAAASRPWMKLLARRDQAGVARFMQALDLFVLPSRTTPRWEEQFGLVLPEAMACGVPVLGTRSGAIPELLEPPCMIVQQSDPTAIAEALAASASHHPESAAHAAITSQAPRVRFGALSLSESLLRAWGAS